jgi:hypothetical protein
VAIDDGLAVHYTAVTPGTLVYSSDEVELGSVTRVLDNEREHIFDGIVMSTGGGERFVDAPEVARTAERAVTLNITAEQAEELEPPESGGAFSLKPPGPGGGGGGFLARLFGRRR